MAIQRTSSDFEARYRKPKEDRLTTGQLNALNDEIMSLKGDGSFDLTVWMQKRGAMNKNGAVIVTNYTRAEYNSDGTRLVRPADCDPILYEQLLKDLDQYNNWKFRRRYAEERRLEDLERSTLPSSNKTT